MQVSSIITMEDTPELRLGVRCVLLQLFEHNEKAYRSAVQMMEECGKAAIVHPTGTGKSYIAFKLIEEHPADTIFWLSPSEYIFKTQIENLKRQAPDISLANVHFYTYAKLMCCATEELEAIAGLNPTYIILDEFHRVGAECWGESTVALLKLCPDAKLLGLTATNIRYLDNNRDMAEELFGGHIASEMTLGEAIVRGILPAPKYVTTVYQYQKELTRYQNRIDNLRSAGIQDVNQKYLDALRRALEKADGLDEVFARHITNKSGKYIVFCANKEHMDEMISHVPEWFAGVNPDVAVYEAYSDDPGTDRAFADFKADQSKRLKLLFCIDMLNEGVHVEGVSGVILFRPTVSPIIYKQQIGRALTAGDSKTPLYFLVFSSVLNIFLDILFIVPLHMGVAGAAWATILSQFLSAVLSLLVGMKKFQILHLHREDFHDLKDAAVLHLKTGFPMGFQMSVMCIGQLAMQAVVNSLGTAAVAGYTAASKADQLSVLVNNAMMTAISNYVAQNFGAGKKERIRQGVRACLIQTEAFNLFMCVGILILRHPIVRMFLSDPTVEIYHYSDAYLTIVAPFYFILGLLAVYRTSIQSMQNGRAPFAACMIELVMRIAATVGLSGIIGYTSVCIASPLAWFGACALLIPVYYRMMKRPLASAS